MISFFANIFGYVLNFLYELVGNYGLAIILFSILVKIIMIPISIKQQKTMKTSQKINKEMKQIQFKYKNDPEKLNQEVMALYKRENMSPFSGCFSAIVQVILLFSVFYLVRSPLTYMKKVDREVIKNLQAVVEQSGNVSNYKEIAIINYVNKIKNGVSVSENQNEEFAQESEEVKEISEENENIEEDEEDIANENEQNTESNGQEKEKNNSFDINDYIDEVYVNMNFLGLDLSKVPTEDLTDLKVLIIPVLYVISSFISIRLSTNMQNNQKKHEKVENEEDNGKENPKEEVKEYDAMQEANKSMTWFMPIMSISIACIAPLGLALYWLVNNLLMILERFILNKFIKDDEKEETKSNA